MHRANRVRSEIHPCLVDRDILGNRVIPPFDLSPNIAHLPAMRVKFPAVLILMFTGLTNPLAAQLASSSIEAAHEYSRTHSGVGLIIEEEGKTRFEQYYNGHSGNEPLHIYSGTKSYFGVLAVIAEEEGLLKLDEPVAQTLPEWREDTRKQLVTLRDLLNFTSGLETGFEEIYGSSSADKLALSVGLKATRDRGASFVYGPSHLQVFCEVLRRKLASKGLGYEDYLQKRLIKPLDIRITQWRADSHGNVIPSAGMYMTGRDWLKFGELVLNGGTWKGRRLVSTEALSKCFVGTPINPAFGQCFWVNSYRTQDDAREVDVELFLEREPLPEDWSRACLCKSAPTDLICSLGSNFQRLYLVPSMQLVVVHQGKKGNDFRDAEFLSLLFRDAASPASEETTTKKIRPILPKLFGGSAKSPQEGQ